MDTNTERRILQRRLEIWQIELRNALHHRAEAQKQADHAEQQIGLITAQIAALCDQDQ